MKRIKFLLLTLAALLGTVTASASKTVYIQPNDWANDNAVISLWVWGGTNTGSWWTEDNTLTEVESGIFKATLDDEITSMKITRGKVGNTWESGDEAKWNESGDITIEAGKLYKANGYDNNTMVYTVEDYTEPVAAGYTCDFNTTINTSNHDFKVAKGWSHIVGKYNDGWGDNYMTYSYYAESGVDGTGALYAARQYAGDSWDGEVVSDVLVTPAVNGTVTLAVKAASGASSSNNAFVEVYAINADGTLGDKLKTIKEEIDGYSDGPGSWATFTLAELTEAQKLGLRCQYVYIDNFTAGSADIPVERTLEVTKVADLNGNTGYSGSTTYFYQQPDGTLKVQLQVTLTNTGDVDFAAGEIELTACTSKKEFDDYAVAINEALAVGETKTIDVDFNVPYADASGTQYWYIKDNITNTISSSYRYVAGTKAYESKFVFDYADGSNSSSLSSAIAFGMVNETTTLNYEIRNTGTAPLTVNSITLPEQFTTNEITFPLTLNGGEKQLVDITLSGETLGSFSGDLVISYTAYGAEEATDFTLGISGNVLAAGTWSATFDGADGFTYPAGSVAESGIRSGYKYNSGTYNYFLRSYTYSMYATANNKFITPKLHANAGDVLKFDVAYDDDEEAYNMKVYVSTDRTNWGEPVATFNALDEGISDTFVQKEISFSEEGDYYVAFAIYGMLLDNVLGLQKVDVDHDLYIKSVSWPDASVKSGTSLSKPIVTIIPLTTETAEDYTVKYMYGETVLGEGTPVALTASATSTKEIAINWTPNVESTTVYEGTKVVIEFTDGTTFETETFDLTVTNEPIFHFVSSIPSSKWYEPTDYTTPYSFGKTNTADSKTFYVYNWGSAALTVKSITAPEGFTVTPAEEFTVAAFNVDDLDASAQAVEVTFSATETGEYSGNLVVTYVNAAGEDATFELAISGTKLDPTKFYANFDNGGWPAGSVYQSNISSTNGGTYSVPNYYITSSSTTNNLFVMPKLTAADGDKLLFDAKLYSTGWSEGKVVVYAAATRDEVLNAEEGTTRTQLFSVSGQDEENALTTDYQTFEVPAVAGDNYYAFEISSRALVDEIYGLAVAEVAHDWKIASSNIPATGMQNYSSTATVNVLNLGLADEAADSYTVTAYIDGEAAATGEAVALPMNHKLSDAGTQLSVSYMMHKPGTYSVYLKVAAGDYSVQTEAVDVTIAEEVAVAEAIEVGAGTTFSREYAPIDFYNYEQARTSDILYTNAQLTAFGLKSGDKIMSLAFKANAPTSKTMSSSTLTAWVALSTGDITYGSPDKDAMTEITVYNAGEMKFALDENIITIALPEAITFDGTSDLRIYLEGGGNSEYATLTFAYDTNYQNMKWSNATSMKYNPLLYVTLAAEPVTIAGTVKNVDGEAIEGAAITLVSTDGDNIQYSGETDSEGAYSINVIQATREYNVTVVAGGLYKDIAEVVSFAEGSVEKDFTVKVDPTKLYIDNPTFAGTPIVNGVTTYAKDAAEGQVSQMQAVDGWTFGVDNGDARASGVFAIGGSAFLGGAGYLAPTAGPNGETKGNVLGMIGVWTNTVQYLNKEVTLPVGTYKLTVPVYNAAGTSTPAKSLIGFIANDSTEYVAEASAYTVGAWTNEVVTFSVEEETTGKFSLGLTQTNVGSGSAPHLFIGALTLEYKSLLDGAIEALEAEIAAAEALKTEARTEGLDEFNAAIETAKGFLTSDDAAAVNTAVEALKAAETAFLTANLPVAQGVYYVYNSYSQKFLSRGSSWGTRAVGDDYGLPFNLTADVTNTTYKLQMLDNGVYYGDDYWMYADCSGDRVRSYTLEAAEGGYYLHNTARDVADNRMYIYLKDDADKYCIAGNAVIDDNISDEAQTVWQFLTQAERDNIIAAREAAEKNAAFAAAGISEGIEGESVELTFATGSAWTFTAVRSGSNATTNDNGTEVFQGTGSFTQAVEGLESGLYKVTIQAFYRDGSNEAVAAFTNEGYNLSVAYLEANGNKAQVKSWGIDRAADNNPNSMAEAKALFDDGKYLSEVYTYVGEDGKLDLTVANPSHIGAGWFIAGNVKYAKVEDSTTTAITAAGAAVETGQVFDMQGRRMEGKLKKGVYIINGKKTVVK